MAQLTKCDRCGVVPPDDEPTETITARNVTADLCGACAAEILDPWLADVVARVSTVPTVPPSRHAWPRPPQHGYTADAIEVASTPNRPALS